MNNLKKEKIYVSILINNAAIDSKINNKGKFENKNRIENLSLLDWNKQIEVGLTGAMLCSKFFGSEMAIPNVFSILSRIVLRFLNIFSFVSGLKIDFCLFSKY